jgi:hypothetical protein
MVFNAGFTGQVSTGKNILIAFSFDDPSSLPTMITHAYFYLCHYAMQATAISRIFTCIACNMFRINQLATAKDNLDFMPLYLICDMPTPNAVHSKGHFGGSQSFGWLIVRKQSKICLEEACRY